MNQRSKGFTIIELVLVVAIGVILATVGVINIQKFRNAKDVEFSLNELAAAVEETRARSVAQENGKRWSVRFISTSTGTDAYEVYTGAVYASSNVVSYRSLRRSIEFGEPSGDRIIDLNFEPVTGRLANKKVITLVSSKKVQKIGDVILDIFGRVTKRIEDDLVGYWHFDEGTGTDVRDASGNGVDGTLYNSPTWQVTSSCRAGRCLSFDGIDDYVLINDNAVNGATSASICGWIKSSTTGQYQGLFGYEADNSDSGGGTEGFFMRIDSSNNLELIINGEDDLAEISFSSYLNGSWHHICGVYNGSLRKIYIDGTEELSNSFSEAISVSSYPYFEIGRYTWGDLSSSYYFNGSIDEVRIYNRALTADEVKARYNDLR